jgi:hypothetical protein
MATQKIQFGYTSAQTLVVSLIPLGGNSVLFNSATAIELPSGSGIYTATFTEVAALNATYRAFVKLGGTGVASFEAKFTGTNLETIQATEFVDAGGTSPSDITNAVWNPQLSLHQLAGSTGEALEKASVGTQNAYVLPISTTDPCAPRGTALTAFVNGDATFVIGFKDAAGVVIDPTLESLYFVVEDASAGTDMVIIPDGSLTKSTTNITFTVQGSDNTPIGSYRWAVRTTTNEKVLAYGVYNIQYAAQDDTP